MSVAPRLPRKPEARTEKVEDLVEQVRRGVVRVPEFQRGLKWESDDVADLFDSIYRGYPVGSLLFYKRPARAGRVEVGPLLVDAEETSEAWWVVDGQQRLTALAGCLARPVPIPVKRSSGDPYVLYFDARNRKFEPPPTSGEIPAHWVPLPHLLDASRLTEWVFTWELGTDEELRRGVFEAGSRIREYTIPIYLIETEDEKVSEEIFYRVNNTGKPLKWTEVHKALFGGGGSSPATLAELAEELSEVGMGRLDEERLLTCLMALRGLDPTRSPDEHRRRDGDFLTGAVPEALPVLRRVLSFLRTDARVPHLRLLPSSFLLDVLVRFFSRHEAPGPRTRILLSRWFWRIVLGGGAYDDRTLQRRGVAAVTEDEEASVQALLGLVRKDGVGPFELPERFDARADASRVALLALADLGPRHLESGDPLDVAGLLDEDDRAAFAKIVKSDVSGVSRSPANRLIHPPAAAIDRLLRLRARQPGAAAILASHAIDPLGVEALEAGDPAAFLDRRLLDLTNAVRSFADRMAEWSHSDRPSIDYVLQEAGVET